KAVEDSSKSDKKNEVLYKKLEGEISELNRKIDSFEVYLNATEEEIKKIKANIQDAERHVNNADALETINNRIKNIENQISNQIGRIDENYTTSLFDEIWILVNFESFHKEFAEKVSAHSKT